MHWGEITHRQVATTHWKRTSQGGFFQEKALKLAVRSHIQDNCRVLKMGARAPMLSGSDRLLSRGTYLSSGGPSRTAEALPHHVGCGERAFEVLFWTDVMHRLTGNK